MQHIPDYQQFNKNIAEGKVKESKVNEGKGQDLADKYVAKLRSEFRKLNDDELDEFKKTITQSLDLNESINEAQFKHINKSEHKIKLAIKDVEKKSRLKINRDKEPEYEQLALNKIMLSKVLGRERLGKEHVAAWEKLKKEYELTESVNEAIEKHDESSKVLKNQKIKEVYYEMGTYYIELSNGKYIRFDVGGMQPTVGKFKDLDLSESVNERFKHNDMYAMLDIAAGYSSTQHQAANQMWSDAQDLYDYLKSDHIPKKYHKDFYNDVKRRFPLSINESVNEASSPMSSILQSFEKAMTDKKAYAKLASEMSAAPANEKQMIMQMANKNIPEAGANIQGMIDSLNDGSLTADILGMSGGEAKAISQFKKALKVVDFAIKTIKQHVNESVTEGQDNPVDKKFIRDWEKLCLAMIGRLKIDMRQAPVESRSLFTKNIKRIEDVLDIPTEISYFTESKDKS